MNIRLLSLASLLALGMLAACSSSEKPKDENNGEEPKAEAKEMTYEVFAPSSEVSWKGQMVGGMYYHTGTLQLSDGTITTKDGKVTGGKFTIDWSTLAVTDSNYSEDKPSAYLIQHLKSPDFFAVDSLGAAMFEITGMEGDDIVGNLTIRGITNPEKVTNVSITEDENGITASGDLVFDRQKYNVSYENTMGDAVISDDIETSISFTGKPAGGAM